MEPSRSSGTTGAGSSTVLPMIVGGAIAALLVLKALRRSARFATRDTRALAAACRRDVAGYLADQGVDVPPSATMPEVGAMLQRFYSVDATSFVRDVTVARFGPPAPATEALAAPVAACVGSAGTCASGSASSAACAAR